MADDVYAYAYNSAFSLDISTSIDNTRGRPVYRYAYACAYVV